METSRVTAYVMALRVSLKRGEISMNLSYIRFGCTIHLTKTSTYQKRRNVDVSQQFYNNRITFLSDS